MDQTNLISTVQTYLSDSLPVPVRTRGGTEDERPVPAVILEGVDVTDLTFHNTHLAQVVEQGSPGVPDEWYFRFHYRARLDYLVRHKTDLKSSNLVDNLRQVMLPLVENPRVLHDDINRVRLRGGGGFSVTNVEDSESEMNQAVQIRTFHQMNNLDDAAFDDSTLDTIQNKMDDGYDDDFTVTN